MSKLLLDLCCKAGGASMGYAQAGFNVVGVDIEDQPNYPFDFIQADIHDLDPELLDMADVIAASPPCQIHSIATEGRDRSKHIDLIPFTRELLIKSGKPYVIENVDGAPLQNAILLCGSSFKLRVRRHRLFESNIKLYDLDCQHEWQEASKIYTVRLSKGNQFKSGTIPVFGGNQLVYDSLMPWETELGLIQEAMEIPWMKEKNELNQAIPPAYTKFIGNQLMQLL